MADDLSRRRFLRESGAAALGAALLPFPRIHAQMEFDLVVRGAMLIDGTGGPPWRADIGVTGDAIAALGSISPEQARRVLDASGLAVSPGFIDTHTHSDDSILRYPTADSRVRQGVTTEITGNCGSSAAPMSRAQAERRLEEPRGPEGGPFVWTDVRSYFNLLEKTGMSVNHALLLGHGTVRQHIVGQEDRELTADELKQAIRMVEEALDQGVIGLSTGLEYVPGRFTPPEEIAALAHVVARRGGLYASHIRNEESALLEALDEAIRVGRLTGVRVQVSHLKAAGRPNWGKQDAALDLVESARRAGVNVLADAYPYAAYSTGLSIFMPGWALAGGWAELEKRLEDAADRARIRKELIGRVRRDPGDYELIVLSSVKSERNLPLVGKNMAQVAGSWDMEPVDALIRLLQEEEGAAGFIGHGMNEANVEKVLAHPLVMIGSDGYSIAPTGSAARTRPHPRSYGTFPRVLGHYRREKKLFDLPTAIRKMTGMPADQAGIRDRGRIARGMKADLVVFDADSIRDRSTFEDPHRYGDGICHVLVNGVAVVENGVHTGARPGRILRGM